jgi:hypothetical protein
VHRFSSVVDWQLIALQCIGHEKFPNQLNFSAICLAPVKNALHSKPIRWRLNPFGGINGSKLAV